MSTKRICKKILAIGSHFWIKRGQRGQKRYFYRINHVYRFVIFYLILMKFFSFDSSLKELLEVCYRFDKALTVFEMKGIWKNQCIFYLLRPRNHRVQQITVLNTLESSSLMHPYSLGSTLLQISVVDMLQSYHVVLVVALNLLRWLL